MMGNGKEVLLLKDSALKGLQTDLAGKLYKQFDTLNITSTMFKDVILATDLKKVYQYEFGN